MNIKAMRLKHGLDQQTLAKKAGINRIMLSKIERGKTAHPRIDTLAKLASAMDCTLDELVNGNTDKPA